MELSVKQERQNTGEVRIVAARGLNDGKEAALRACVAPPTRRWSLFPTLDLLWPIGCRETVTSVSTCPCTCLPGQNPASALRTSPG